jgi:hypothetical protein
MIRKAPATATTTITDFSMTSSCSDSNIENRIRSMRDETSPTNDDNTEQASTTTSTSDNKLDDFNNQQQNKQQEQQQPNRPQRTTTNVKIPPPGIDTPLVDADGVRLLGYIYSGHWEGDQTT